MVRRRRKVTHDEAYGAVQLEFLKILKTNGPSTVDAIHERLEIPDSARMKIGRAIRALDDDGRIEAVDHERTQRQKAHGRTVRLWRLVE